MFVCDRWAIVLVQISTLWAMKEGGDENSMKEFKNLFFFIFSSSFLKLIHFYSIYFATTRVPIPIRFDSDPDAGIMKPFALFTLYIIAPDHVSIRNIFAKTIRLFIVHFRITLVYPLNLRRSTNTTRVLPSECCSCWWAVDFWYCWCFSTHFDVERSNTNSEFCTC